MDVIMTEKKNPQNQNMNQMQIVEANMNEKVIQSLMEKIKNQEEVLERESGLDMDGRMIGYLSGGEYINDDIFYYWNFDLNFLPKPQKVS